MCDNGHPALGELRLDVDHGNVMTCVRNTSVMRAPMLPAPNTQTFMLKLTSLSHSLRMDEQVLRIFFKTAQSGFELCLLIPECLSRLVAVLVQEVSHAVLLILGSEALCEAVALELQSGVQVGLHANVYSFLNQGNSDRSLSSDLLGQSFTASSSRFSSGYT